VEGSGLFVGCTDGNSLASLLPAVSVPDGKADEAEIAFVEDMDDESCATAPVRSSFVVRPADRHMVVPNASEVHWVLLAVVSAGVLAPFHRASRYPCGCLYGLHLHTCRQTSSKTSVGRQRLLGELFVERHDVGDVVPLNLMVVPIRADGHPKADLLPTEVGIHGVRLELGKIEVRVETGERGLGAPRTIASERGVVAEGPLLALVVELEDPRKHRQALGLTQSVLDRVDVAIVDTTRDDLVGSRLDRREVNDLRELLVGVFLLVGVRGVERSGLLLRLFGCLRRGPRGGCPPLLSGRSCCPPRLRCCAGLGAADRCHILHPFERDQ